MPQYAVIQHHPANICPMTNKTVRNFAKEMFPKLPALGAKLGVKVVTNIHLDPDHKAFLLLYAKSAEAARDFLVQGGFAHFTEMNFYLVTPVEELLKQADSMPTIF